MNNIVKEQNSLYSINLLKAQRVAYDKAKKTKTLEKIIIILSLSAPFLILFYPEINKTGSIGLTTLLLVIFSVLIKRLYNRYTIIGAKIQEEFDTLLFKIPWNSVFVGDKVGQEKINDLSKNYFNMDLGNWYSKNLDPQIEENIAVLVCQRINLFWDSELRKKWINFLILFTFVYYLIYFLICLSSPSEFHTILTSLVPTVLYINFIYNQYITNKIVIEDKSRLLIHLQRQFENYKEKKVIPSKIDLRQNQDVIFKLRRTYQKTPNWFYNWFKEDFGETIDKTVLKIINSL